MPDDSDAGSTDARTSDAVERSNADAAPTGKARMFVTSDEFTGQISARDALRAADERCTEIARSAGLRGTFTAYLSAGSAGAASRILGSGPWYAVGDDAEPLFAARSGIDAVSWTAGPKVRDEHGKLAIESRGLAFSVWTGTMRDGSAGASCNDWTEATGTGVIGAVCESCAAYEWRNDQDIGHAGSATYPCEGTARIYCFESR